MGEMDLKGTGLWRTFCAKEQMHYTCISIKKYYDTLDIICNNMYMYTYIYCYIYNIDVDRFSELDPLDSESKEALLCFANSF